MKQVAEDGRQLSGSSTCRQQTVRGGVSDLKPAKLPVNYFWLLQRHETSWYVTNEDKLYYISKELTNTATDKGL